MFFKKIGDFGFVAAFINENRLKTPGADVQQGWFHLLKKI